MHPSILFCLSARISYTVFNNSKGNRSDIVIRHQALKYDPQPCYLGMCLSNAKIDLSSVILRKASKAAFALSSVLTSTTSATLINKLFSQLIEPILLYAAEQWIPYVHPRKEDKIGITPTFTPSTSQLNTEDIWKRMVYSHY